MKGGPMSRKDNKGRVLKPGEFQRSNGTYEYRYNDVSGKSRSLYAKTLPELREKEFTVSECAHVVHSSSGITVYDYAKKYLDSRTDLRDTTRANHLKALTLLRDDPFMKTDIAQATRRGYGEMLDRVGKDISRPTLCGYIVPIRAAMRHAFRRELIDSDPCVVAPEPANPPEKKKALTKEQYARILDLASSFRLNPVMKEHIIVLAETGLRACEYLGLTEKDVDFENGILHVSKQRLRLMYDPSHYGFISQPKTQSGIRDIPLTQNAESALRSILTYVKSIRKKISVDGFTNFIVLNTNGYPEHYRTFLYYFNRLTEMYKSKYKEDLKSFTPHILRHTFCTNIVHADIKVSNAQYLMGHSSPVTTLQIYTDVRRNEAIAVMRSKLICTT